MKRFTHDTGGCSAATSIVTVPLTVPPLAGAVIATIALVGVAFGVAVRVALGTVRVCQVAPLLVDSKNPRIFDPVRATHHHVHDAALGDDGLTSGVAADSG
jgi:hypothetical protein